MAPSEKPKEKQTQRNPKAALHSNLDVKSLFIGLRFNKSVYVTSTEPLSINYPWKFKACYTVVVIILRALDICYIKDAVTLK